MIEKFKGLVLCHTLADYQNIDNKDPNKIYYIEEDSQIIGQDGVYKHFIKFSDTISHYFRIVLFAGTSSQILNVSLLSTFVSKNEPLSAIGYLNGNVRAGIISKDDNGWYFIYENQLYRFTNQPNSFSDSVVAIGLVSAEPGGTPNQFLEYAEIDETTGNLKLYDNNGEMLEYSLPREIIHDIKFHNANLNIDGNLILFGDDSKVFIKRNQDKLQLISDGKTYNLPQIGGTLSIVSGSYNQTYWSEMTINGITKLLPDANTLAPRDYVQGNTGTATTNLDRLKIGDTVYSVGSAQAMIYKGTLGTGGDITSLPAASLENAGWTYVVITAGTYAEQSASVGDSFISNGTAWNKIPVGGSYQPKIDSDHKLSASLVSGLTTVATSGSYSDLANKPNLATVATSGSYSDLQNKPTLQQLLQANDKTLSSLSDSVPLILKGASTDTYLEFISGQETTLGKIGFNNLGELVWINGDNQSEVIATESFVDDELENYQPKLIPGNNITISPDGKTISAENTTYNLVTTFDNGLMSYGDKGKLDGIKSGANRTGHSTDSPEDSTNHVVGPISYLTIGDVVSGSNKVAWYTFNDANAVKFTANQGLTSEQQAAARANIGAGTLNPSDLSNYLKNNENATIVSDQTGSVLTLKNGVAGQLHTTMDFQTSGGASMGKLGFKTANKPVIVDTSNNMHSVITGANFTLEGTVLTLNFDD